MSSDWDSNPKSKMSSEGFEPIVAGECGATDDQKTDLKHKEK